MLSHTVPKKLLEHFAYDDSVTRSKRLWRYQKGRPPLGRVAPKSATRWDGHFADPTNAAKEAEVEERLQREFENPVNEFIDLLRYRTFALTPTHIRLLTGYLTILFHRSRARRAASGGQHETQVDALRALRADDDLLAQFAAKIAMDMIPSGVVTMPTKEQTLAAIDAEIAKQTTGDVAQRGYARTMETMMAFTDEGMRDGQWGILRAEPNEPFVIGDAPVVTWERTEQNLLVFGQGFARPNVEVFLPIFPTACLYVLPKVVRTRPVREPSTDDVNMAQAAFATEYCFTNVRSNEIDALLQQHFGTAHIGENVFVPRHINHKEKLFEILMNQPPRTGRFDEEEVLEQ